MVRTFVRIALCIVIGMFSMAVVAKEPLSDQGKNTSDHEPVPKPSNKPPKIILDNPPAQIIKPMSTINADTTKEKAKGNTEVHVNPCNGSSPPDWC